MSERTRGVSPRLLEFYSNAANFGGIFLYIMNAHNDYGVGKYNEGRRFDGYGF